MIKDEDIHEEIAVLDTELAIMRAALSVTRSPLAAQIREQAGVIIETRRQTHNRALAEINQHRPRLLVEHRIPFVESCSCGYLVAAGAYEESNSGDIFIAHVARVASGLDQ